MVLDEDDGGMGADCRGERDGQDANDGLDDSCCSIPGGVLDVEHCAGTGWKISIIYVCSETILTSNDRPICDYASNDPGKRGKEGI